MAPGVPAITRRAPVTRGSHDRPGASWSGWASGDFSGQSFWMARPEQGASERRRRRGGGQGRAGRRELSRSPGPSLRCLYLRALVPGIRRFPCGGATPSASNPGQPLPRRWRPIGSRALAPCAQERRAPPPPVALGSAVAQRGALPRRATSDPRARSDRARRLAFSSADGRWGTKYPDSLANDRRAVERRRVKWKTPGLNSGIYKRGRKGKPLLRSCACWRGSIRRRRAGH